MTSGISRVTRWAAAALVLASWVSAGLFGLYILAFYLGAIPYGRLATWNENLPGVYEPGNFAALIAMGAHLATGGIILVLGPVQLLDRVRQASARLHRILGRVYVITSIVAGVGGLGFIVSKGTIGGPVMDVGFGLYGVLMTWAAVETMRHARAERFETHRAWAIRLFALAIGSWLYRMDYGFWFIAVGKVGHTSDFRGAFDLAMVFLFYVPNLIVAEMFVRARRSGYRPRPVLQGGLAGMLALATVVVAIGTYYFAKLYWLPGIVSGVTGAG